LLSSKRVECVVTLPYLFPTLARHA
jgi:hypothetical protein